jgi:hypothetical protein
MYMKLLRTISVDVNGTDQLIIMQSAFMNYLKKKVVGESKGGVLQLLFVAFTNICIQFGGVLCNILPKPGYPHQTTYVHNNVSIESMVKPG